MILQKLRALVSPLIFHYPSTLRHFLTIISLRPLLGPQLSQGLFGPYPISPHQKEPNVHFGQISILFSEESSWAREIAKDSTIMSTLSRSGSVRR